jgi:hypothetical protein
MSHSLFTSSRLFEFIERIDRDTVAKAAGERCPHCDGALDRADYPRKPRGLPEGDRAMYRRRPSLCCREEGCRRRQTPQLVGFLGRRVYVATIVTLVAVLCQGASSKRLSRLEQTLDVSSRTVRRWLAWWQNDFPKTPGYRRLQAALVTSIVGPLPSAMLARLAPFDEDGFEGALLLLRHLAI